ncbi:MAG: hypothetical protein ABIA63_12865 [bacterium]
MQTNIYQEGKTMGDLFSKRLDNWKIYGELNSFNLACTAEALDTVKSLNDQNIGWEQVEARIGEFKSWDPDIFKVDKDAEDGYYKRLHEKNTPFIFLSEEAGKVEINLDKPGKKRYVVCDPFDGSFLFKHGLPFFWYSSLSFYDEQLNPLSAGVGDCNTREIAFANEKGAFIGILDGHNLIQVTKLDKKYREATGRPDVTKMQGASIESYALKPKKFLIPLLDEYRELFMPFKFILPNGGPYGFVDVAQGKIDCYFARKQPYVDVFSGIYIAQQAEVIVTDFKGNPVKPSDDCKTVWDILVTTNQFLHDEILKVIEKCKTGSK